MKSMTGFGRAASDTKKRKYYVEIRTVNHRFCDILVKGPKTLSCMEDIVRKEVRNEIHRGKVEVFITLENEMTQSNGWQINEELAGSYIRQLRQFAKVNHLKSKISVSEILNFPDVFSVQNGKQEDIIWEELQPVLKQAIESLIEMRTREGEKIKEDLRARMKKIEQKVLEISQYSTGLVEEYVVKLEARIKELLKTDGVDQERLQQEVVIYADKTSIEEELTRLKSHISQWDILLQEEKPIGKKMEFLIQEMNRESNTIGAKSGHIEITNRVIDIKTMLEDIREQIQNIE